MDPTGTLELTPPTEQTAEDSASPESPIDLFDDFLDTGFLSTSIGLTPVAAMDNANASTTAVLGYHLASLSGAVALHIVHSADSIIGRIVDFTG